MLINKLVEGRLSSILLKYSYVVNEEIQNIFGCFIE